MITAQSEPADALRSVVRTTPGGATLLQRGLVVVQAGLSLVLLVGAGLFSQSLSKLQNTDLKLDPNNRYIVHFNPQAAGYSQRQVGDLYRIVEDRFHTLPGVEKVGICSYTPWSRTTLAGTFRYKGRRTSTFTLRLSRRMPNISSQWEHT